MAQGLGVDLEPGWTSWTLSYHLTISCPPGQVEKREQGHGGSAISLSILVSIQSPSWPQERRLYTQFFLP